MQVKCHIPTWIILKWVRSVTKKNELSRGLLSRYFSSVQRFRTRIWNENEKLNVWKWCLIGSTPVCSNGKLVINIWLCCSNKLSISCLKQVEIFYQMRTVSISYFVGKLLKEQSYQHLVALGRSPPEDPSLKRDDFTPFSLGDGGQLKYQQMSLFACELCPKSFNSKQGLTNHIKMSHGNKEDCFVCSFCEKAFPTRGDLNKHMKSHSDDRPHVCHLCKKRYKHSKDLRVHMRSSHAWIKGIGMLSLCYIYGFYLSH